MGDYFGVLGGQGYRIEGGLEGPGMGEGAFPGNGSKKKSNDTWFSSYSLPRVLDSCTSIGIFCIRGLNRNIILS